MSRRMSNSTFLAIHATLWCGLAVFAVLRAGAWSETTQMPPLRETPLVVPPLYDYEVVVSDEQLRRVLNKLRPPFRGDETKINHIDHAMRFWTAEVEFPKPAPGADREGPNRRTISGKQMRQLLTDHRAMVQVYGPEATSLLTDEPTGVGTRVQKGITTSSHVDHTVACLAEVGTPLSFPVFTPTRQTTYRELVEHTFRDFRLNQVEYEWSALTFALFLPPVRQWRTTEGQQMSFDRLARRIMRERQPGGVCYGNHRLHTLTVMLRVDEDHSILSPEVRRAVLDYLQQQTVLLVAHQHPDGFWNGDWPLAPPPDSKPSDRNGDRLQERLLATGHALEWWALAPAELHPPRPVLASAGQWLVREIDNLSEEDTVAWYTYLTHAGRALALWRSRDPAEVMARIADSSPAPTPADKEAGR